MGLSSLLLTAAAIPLAAAVALTMAMITTMTVTSPFSAPPAAAPFLLDRNYGDAPGEEVSLGSSPLAHLSADLNGIAQFLVSSPELTSPGNMVFHFRRVIGGNCCAKGNQSLVLSSKGIGFLQKVLFANNLTISQLAKLVSQ